MKHIFIMNPASGSVNRRDRLVESINAAAEEAGADREIYFTKHQGDCRRYVGEICLKYEAERQRSGYTDVAETALSMKS